MYIRFSFLLYPLTLFHPVPQTHSVWKLSVGSMYPRLSILSFSLRCSLDSAYKWDHVVFVFLWLAYFFLKNIFYWLCYYSCPIFPPLFPSALHTPSHLHSPPLVHVHVSYISSLASTFPILFLTSPCLFSTYNLCYLFSVPLPPLSPSHFPTDNPHVISISMILFLF